MQLLTDAQIPIAPGIQAVHKSNGNRIRGSVRKAIAKNGMSLTDLARETGLDNSQITRMLAEDGAANLHPAFFAAVLAKDHLGVLVSDLCAMVGREAVERKPDPVADNRRLREELARLRDEVDRVLDASQP
jgi:transcriptional regulator with XRE-family HTH domain